MKSRENIVSNFISDLISKKCKPHSLNRLNSWLFFFSLSLHSSSDRSVVNQGNVIANLARILLYEYYYSGLPTPCKYLLQIHNNRRAKIETY